VPTRSDVAYLDASALVKLVLPERETDALRDALPTWSRRATSRISVVEVLRAVRRRDAAVEPDARRLLARLSLLAITDRLLVRAVPVQPPDLSSIDALHVASAAGLGRSLAAFVSYDERQLAAADALGLPTASPG
jgi:predicted nucleic acid-binding protein